MAGGRRGIGRTIPNMYIRDHVLGFSRNLTLGKKIEIAIQSLDCGDKEIRSEAEKVLEEIGKRTVPKLVRAFENAEPRIYYRTTGKLYDRY